MNNRILFSVLSFFVFHSEIYAQEAFSVATGKATGTGGVVSYSVGQVVYKTTSGTNGMVLQGVQHAYEIYIVGINEPEMDTSFSVFPNPTSDNLILQIDDYNNEKLSYQLFDLRGKLLDSKQITSTQTSINTGTLPSAVYTINIVKENQQVIVLKIIKN